MKINNMFDGIPPQLKDEVFEELITHKDLRIELIISKGHTTAQGQWYDKDDNEWVLVLQGAARLEFTDDNIIDLIPGDNINIPAHCRHRVSWTMPDEETIWLAVHYS